MISSVYILYRKETCIMKKDLDADLYPEKCDNVVGFKMTETEKKHLEKHCEAKGVKLSAFCRYAVKKAMNEK